MDLVEGEDWDAPSTVNFNPWYMYKQLSVAQLIQSIVTMLNDQRMRSTNNSCVLCIIHPSLTSQPLLRVGGAGSRDYIHPQYVGSFATDYRMWLQNSYS